MDIHARKFIQRAKNIGPLLAGKDNVKVTIGGSTAFSAGGLINLPSGDFSDPDWVAMSRGWIDHEFGHEKHTEHSYFKQAASNSPALKNILNALEDARMEREVAKEFPGAKTNLSKLVDLAIEKELFCSPDKTASPIQSFILYHGRRFVTAQHALNEYAEHAEQLCREALSDDVVDKLKDLIEQTASARNTSDVYDIAERIVALLEEEKEKQSENDEQNDQSEDDDQQSDDSQNDDTDDKSNNSGTDNDTSNDDGSDSGDVEDDAQSGDSGQSDDINSDDESGQGDISDDNASDDAQGSNSGDDSDDKGDAQSRIKQVIESFLDDDQEQDFHEQIKQMLEADSEEYSEELDEQSEGHGNTRHYDLDVRNELSIKYSGVFDVEDEGQLSNRFYRTLNRVLMDQAKTLTVTRRRGSKIMGSKLAGVPSGNTAVFSHKSNAKSLTAGISILVDASGSMSNEMMRESNKTAYALSKALNRMSLDNQVVYFGAWDEDKWDITDDGDYLYVAKDFKSPLKKDRFSVHPNGTTPTHNAMMYSLLSLGTLNLDNKLMFIITDGDPNYASEVVNMKDLAKKLGVKIIPIGLGTRRVAGFSDDNFVTAQNSSEVNDALQNAIKLKLFA